VVHPRARRVSGGPLENAAIDAAGLGRHPLVVGVHGLDEPVVLHARNLLDVPVEQARIEPSQRLGGVAIDLEVRNRVLLLHRRSSWSVERPSRQVYPLHRDDLTVTGVSCNSRFMPDSSAGRRDELLGSAAGYLLRHGVAGMSLRPMAAAIGTSAR